MSNTFDPPFVPDEGEPNQVAFDYIKGQDFRAVWVDGIIGSPTPSGHIHFALYTERPAIPRRQVHSVDPESGVLSDPIPDRTIGRNSIVREMAIDVHLTPETATAMANWLMDQVAAQKGGKK